MLIEEVLYESENTGNADCRVGCSHSILLYCDRKRKLQAISMSLSETVLMENHFSVMETHSSGKPLQCY